MSAALRYLTAAIKADPSFAAAYDTRSNIYFSMHRRGEGMADRNKAKELEAQSGVWLRDNAIPELAIHLTLTDDAATFDSLASSECTRDHFYNRSFAKPNVVLARRMLSKSCTNWRHSLIAILTLCLPGGGCR
ncbi:MAG: hypothetical protein ACKVP0_28505 [Pirellulaceae bacterium]